MWQKAQYIQSFGLHFFPSLQNLMMKIMSCVSSMIWWLTLNRIIMYYCILVFYLLWWTFAFHLKEDFNRSQHITSSICSIIILLSISMTTMITFALLVKKKTNINHTCLMRWKMHHAYVSQLLFTSLSFIHSFLNYVHHCCTLINICATYSKLLYEITVASITMLTFPTYIWKRVSYK